MGNEVCLRGRQQGEQDHSAWSPGSSPSPRPVSGPPTMPTAPWSSSNCARGVQGQDRDRDGSTDAKLIEIAGKAATGLRPGQPLPEFLTRARSSSRLQGKFKVTPPLLGLSYDAMNLLADAVKRAARPTRRRWPPPSKPQRVQGHFSPVSFTTRTSWPAQFVSWWSRQKFNIAK